MKVIEFENVGKMYRLGRVGTGTLSHDLNRWWQTTILGKEDPYLQIGQTNDRTSKGSSDYVWALKDISFSVEEGEVVGVIGKNGAGKSTLLKLLSNITSPSLGEIRYRGRIASLLEVGTGFHPEMTGRENIYMNGSIMGMTRAEITSKLDEIVDFAGVERYLDTPVKRYSSGMTVRLGFAVAAFLEPEILVVDEVLTVGDAEFQKKAIGKMNNVAHNSGRTILFVSHNIASIKLLCSKGILLENGLLKYEGDIKTAVDKYLLDGFQISQNVYYNEIDKAPGNNDVRIKSFEIYPLFGQSLTVESGIKISFNFVNYMPNVILDAVIEILTAENVIVFHIDKVVTPNKDSKIGTYSVSFIIPPFFLNFGKYIAKIWFCQSQSYYVWGYFNHVFEVNNTLSGQGYNMAALPGVTKPKFDFTCEFHDII